jgi:hypothetical protein
MIIEKQDCNRKPTIPKALPRAKIYKAFSLKAPHLITSHSLILLLSYSLTVLLSSKLTINH